MGLFKKKNNQTEEAAPSVAADPRAEVKKLVLDALNAKLNGTLYDDCVIMPHGFTIDVQIGRVDEADDIKILQVIFIVKHDDFDEPLIEPVDAQGKTDEEAANMSVEIFHGGVWHPLDQSMTKKNPIHIPVDFLRQHYDFDMYCQSVVRIGVKNKPPTLLMNFIKNEIPKYLGSKKYYWFRVYLAKFKEKKIIEVRVNGSVCVELPKYFEEYVEKKMDAEEKRKRINPTDSELLDDEPAAPTTPVDDRIRNSADVKRLRQQLASDEKAYASLPAAQPSRPAANAPKKPNQLDSLFGGAKKPKGDSAQQRPSTYTVQEGDTLYKISERFYGSSRMWRHIREANKAIISTDGRVRTGQVLTLP